jgi:CTP:molybdopterin cytidylyltransferase MocA
MRGADKLAEVVAGQPLLRRQAQIARAATRGAVLVTLPDAAHQRAEQLHALDVRIVPVPRAREGMSASLKAGIAALPAGSPAVMILLADLPELEATDLGRVLDAVAPESGTRVWRGATAEGKPGHPLVIHAELFPAFQALAGDTGGREVLAEYRDRTQLIPLPGQRALRDLDTPEAWAAWREDRENNL